MTNKITIIAIFCLLLFQSCATVKVVNSWKADKTKVDDFKKRNILVIARANNNRARIAFEKEIANQLRANGIKATESFTKAPNMHAEKEMSEERKTMIRSILNSEGFDGIVITVVKDKKQTTTTGTNGVYMGASYSNFYPRHYGGFYNYYSYPYAYGSYYNSFGGQIAGSTYTTTSTDYVLETVFYNLNELEDDQLVAVVAANLDDPKDAFKTAEKYVDEMVKALQ